LRNSAQQGQGVLVEPNPDLWEILTKVRPRDDTEGFDLPILRSIDWKRYRPAVVCVEATGGARQPILELMAALDYDVRGSTFGNTIFVDHRLL
jgi:hypothetical protein